MEELIHLLMELQDESSKNKKEQIILKNKDNTYFIKTLEFLCNPYKVSNISTKKINKKIDKNTKNNLNYLEMIDYLVNNCTGTDNDIAFVQNYLSKFDDITTYTLKKIFTKTLKLGVTSKTINKVIPNLIPSFDVMLAESYEKNQKVLDNEHIIISLKLDGTRIVAINIDGKVSFLSRQGQAIEGLVEIEPIFKNLPNGVYDGELLAVGEFENSKDRFQETMKRSRTKGDKIGLEMVCFDYIENIENFTNGVECVPCIMRKNKLENILKDNNEFIRYLKPLYVGGYDPNVLNKLMDEVTANKEEGLMINISSAPYKCKRTKDLLKVKKFYNIDLRIVDVQEGTNKNEGKLGAIIVEYKGHRVGVGSGFDDSQREQLWKNKDSLIGTIVEVRYFEETTNQEGGISLRFPTFVRLREDKDEVSYH